MATIQLREVPEQLDEAIERIEAVLGDQRTSEPTTASIVAELDAERR